MWNHASMHLVFYLQPVHIQLPTYGICFCNACVFLVRTSFSFFHFTSKRPHKYCNQPGVAEKGEQGRRTPRPGGNRGMASTEAELNHLMDVMGDIVPI
jgi:hypothetical protein